MPGCEAELNLAGQKHTVNNPAALMGKLVQTGKLHYNTPLVKPFEMCTGQLYAHINTNEERTHVQTSTLLHNVHSAQREHALCELYWTFCVCHEGRNKVKQSGTTFDHDVTGRLFEPLLCRFYCKEVFKGTAINISERLPYSATHLAIIDWLLLPSNSSGHRMLWRG